MGDFSRFIAFLLRQGAVGGVEGAPRRLLREDTVRSIWENQLPGGGSILDHSFQRRHLHCASGVFSLCVPNSLLFNSWAYMMFPLC